MTRRHAGGIRDAPSRPCDKTCKENPWLDSTGEMLGSGGAGFVEVADGAWLIYMRGWLAPDVGDPGGVRKLLTYRPVFNGKSAPIAPM